MPQAGPQGFANWEERKPNFDRGRGLGCGLQLVESYGSERRRGIPKKMPGQNEGCPGRADSQRLTTIVPIA